MNKNILPSLKKLLTKKPLARTGGFLVLAIKCNLWANNYLLPLSTLSSLFVISCLQSDNRSTHLSSLGVCCTVPYPVAKTVNVHQKKHHGIFVYNLVTNLTNFLPFVICRFVSPRALPENGGFGRSSCKPFPAITAHGLCRLSKNPSSHPRTAISRSLLARRGYLR